jgi:hypothetical protein
LVFLLNFLKYPTPVFSRHLVPSLHQLFQHAILVSSLTLHCLSIPDPVHSVSKSCFLSIHEHRRIRNTLDYTTAHVHYRHIAHPFQARSLQLAVLEPPPFLNSVVFSSSSTLLPCCLTMELSAQTTQVALGASITRHFN